MDYNAALAFSLPIGLAIAALASGIALGKVVSSAMDAIARQPEAASKIQMGMIIGCAFIEALTIYALLTVILLMGKIGAVAH